MIESCNRTSKQDRAGGTSYAVSRQDCTAGDTQGRDQGSKDSTCRWPAKLVRTLQDLMVGCVATVLAFSAHTRLSGEELLPDPRNGRRATTVRRAIDKTRKEHAKHAVDAVKEIRNGPGPKNLIAGSQV